MALNTMSVDAYLADGCGRCEHYQTPQCKVHLWTGALEGLRAIVRASELTEEMKWGSPCYTLGGKNVAMIAAFKDFCALSFFKGALLSDPQGMLELAGPNTQAARLFKFTSAAGVRRHKTLITRMLEQAIELQKSGATVIAEAALAATPAELQRALDNDPALRSAFEGLTPGRRRSHVLHVSGAKQTKTREARAERCAAKVLAGKGFNER